MNVEKSTTDPFLAVTTKSAYPNSIDQGQAIRRNFEELQREFPKLNIEQMGPTVIIYRYKKDKNGKQYICSEIETAYPIRGGSEINTALSPSLVLRELPRRICLRHEHKGPVWETPWKELFNAALEAECSEIQEVREVYKTFKGGSSEENEIEIQIIIE